MRPVRSRLSARDVEAELEQLPTPCIWLGGCPKDVSERELERVCARYGRVVNISVKTSQRDTFAFVQYERLKDAKEAIMSMDQVRLFGQGVCKVAPASRKNSQALATTKPLGRPSKRSRSPSHSRSHSRSRSRPRPRGSPTGRTRDRSDGRSRSSNRRAPPPARDRRDVRDRRPCSRDPRDRQGDRDGRDRRDDRVDRRDDRVDRRDERVDRRDDRVTDRVDRRDDRVDRHDDRRDDRVDRRDDRNGRDPRDDRGDRSGRDLRDDRGRHGDLRDGRNGRGGRDDSRGVPERRDSRDARVDERADGRGRERGSQRRPSRSPSRRGARPVRVFLSQLPSDMEDSELQAFGKEYGAVVACELRRDGSSKSGFLDYGTAREAERAIQELDDRRLVGWHMRLKAHL